MKRLAALKDKIIAQINAADPPLKKTGLSLPGFAGVVLKAVGEGITAKLDRGEEEFYAWADLTAAARRTIGERFVDPGSADDMDRVGYPGVDP